MICISEITRYINFKTLSVFILSIQGKQFYRDKGSLAMGDGFPIVY